MSANRIETDSIGKIEVPTDCYYGAQTQRALNHFKIGEQFFPSCMMRAFAQVKKAAALTNSELGLMPDWKCELIVLACDELIAGKHALQFPLNIWQSGSGTQTHMNVNEVIANRAIELSGGRLGSKHPIHPNDDVNLSQSTNDVFPSVMHLAALDLIHKKLLPHLIALHEAFTAKSQEYCHLIKIARTHMMDATPITLGQELGAYAAQLQFVEGRLLEATEMLYELALGGSAVGTGLNTHPDFAEAAVAHLARLSSLPLQSAKNKFAALAAHDALVHFSGVLRNLAVICLKIGNDIKLLASGPRCGLGEIQVPENEPGSSIMPGKVNPTQAEALCMVAVRVIGNDCAIGLAGSQGQLDLNTYKPVLIFCLLESIELLAGACLSFRIHCVEGISARPRVLQKNLENSLMLVTALNPILGYDRAAEIAQYALDHDIGLRQASLSLGYLTAEEFDHFVVPEDMLSPQNFEYDTSRKMAERKSASDRIDRAEYDSFPASDPPGYSTMIVGAPLHRDNLLIGMQDA